MTYDFTFPARAAFNDIGWPESAVVVRAIHLFSTERAPSLPEGSYPLRAAGYAMRLRVNRKDETVLVLYIVRAR